jgi:hypothetical protein
MTITDDKPAVAAPTVETYPEWARVNLQTRFDAWEKMVFSTNAQTILNAARNHEFFREMRSILASAARDFETSTGARLFVASPSGEPGLQLATKSYEMTVEKSYRMNVLRNKAFPGTPKTGWVRPPTWYSHLNDIVRGTIICSYLDGLPWLAQRLRVEAEKRSLRVAFNSEQRDEGYYAFHVYATLPAITLQVREADDSIVERAFDVSVEVQLTTQLQDALREVTHFFYEERRVHGLPPDWKWHHNEPHFRASYISHSLHLLDAIIVELRQGLETVGKPPVAVVAGPEEARQGAVEVTSEHDSSATVEGAVGGAAEGTPAATAESGDKAVELTTKQNAGDAND